MKTAPRVLAACLALAFFTQPARAGETNDEATITISVPSAVKAALIREAAGGRILDLRREGDAEAAYYEATIRTGKLDYSVIVEADGTLLRKELKDPQEAGETVRLKDLPEKVRAALAREAPGGEVQSIRSQKATFTVLAETNGRLQTIVIDADGTLIRKEAGDVSDITVPDAPVSSPANPGSIRFTHPAPGR